jgi:hypothetical protein
MKLFTGWVMSAGLVLAATSANAQMLAPDRGGGPPYSAVADIDSPYAAMPPDVHGPAPGPVYSPAPGGRAYYGPAPEPAYGPRLLPPLEVYAVVRENGFSPLGPPQQRGMFYTIAVIDRGGGDGRLVIDARDGRIVRFMPAWRSGGNYNPHVAVAYGPPGAPPVSAVRGGPPRPPALVPHVASRSVPLPRATPQRSSEPQVANKPSQPVPQSMAMEAKPAVPVAPPAQPPAVIEAKPAPQIQPTGEMPKVQDLE